MTIYKNTIYITIHITIHYLHITKAFPESPGFLRAAQVQSLDYASS